MDQASDQGAGVGMRKAALPLVQRDKPSVFSARTVLRKGLADPAVRQTDDVGGPSRRLAPGRSSAGERGCHCGDDLVHHPRVPPVTSDAQRPTVWGLVSDVAVSEVAAEEIAIRGCVRHMPVARNSGRGPTAAWRIASMTPT